MRATLIVLSMILLPGAAGETTAPAAYNIAHGAMETADRLRDAHNPLLPFLVAEITAANASVNATEAATLLLAAGECNDTDPLLLAALARFESHYRRNRIGAAGERGMLQIHPCHKKSMKAAGLDFYSEADRLTYACMLYAEQGWKPWTVREKAKKEYYRLQLAYVDWEGE